jgi:hypothetical protein
MNNNKIDAVLAALKDARHTAGVFTNEQGEPEFVAVLNKSTVVGHLSFYRHFPDGVLIRFTEDEEGPFITVLWDLHSGERYNFLPGGDEHPNETGWTGL